jgi:hypothetical protein
MKKILHYIFILAAFVFLYNIIQILSLGISSLSEFGYGALLGKFILFLICVYLVFITRHKRLK